MLNPVRSSKDERPSKTLEGEVNRLRMRDNWRRMQGQGEIPYNANTGRDTIPCKGEIPYNAMQGRSTWRGGESKEREEREREGAKGEEGSRDRGRGKESRNKERQGVIETWESSSKRESHLGFRLNTLAWRE